jgi:hypothetical protein
MNKFAMLCLLGAAISGTSFATVDNDLLSLAPAGTSAISSIDVKQARNSQFGQYLLGRMNPQNSDFQRFVQLTGFDPRVDLDTVLMIQGSARVASSPPQNMLVLARGNFRTHQIAGALRAKGATVQTYHGVQIFTDPNNQQTSAFAFPHTGCAIMGDLLSVEQGIDNQANPAALDPTLQQLITNVASNDAWFVSLSPGPFLMPRGSKQQQLPAQAQAMQSIVQASGGIRFGEIVQVSLNAVTRSAKDATSLVDVIRFMGSMVQMQRDKAPAASALASAVDNMALTSSGNTVQVALSMPESNLEQVANLGLGFSRRH